jgi:small GTP-binding protein
VGKTSIAIRFVQGVFSQDQPSTIGASFFTKRLVIGEWKLKAQIWDTAGQERFRSMTPMYYRGAQGAVVMYDITNAESFEAVKTWIAELRSTVSSDIAIAVVGNKCDMPERKVEEAVARAYAVENECMFFETSAKEDKGISDVFMRMCEILVQKHAKKAGGSGGGGAAGGTASGGAKGSGGSAIFLDRPQHGQGNQGCKC